MDGLGLRVQQILVDEEQLASHPTAVEVPWDGKGRPNVVGRWPGSGSGASLILNAHVDVVSPEPVSKWTVDPYGGGVRDGRLYGRGAADMKGGWIAIHAALEALKRAGYEPPGEILFESVVEEEAGGTHGTLACRLAGIAADAMVITEPLYTHLVIGHPGVLYFRVKVEGKPVHAALAHSGVNAIYEALPVVKALKALDEKRGREHRSELFERLPGTGDRSVHLNVGVIKAGDWPSTVPGFAQIECRISYLPSETEEEIKQAVAETVQKVQSPWLRDHPPVIEWFGWRARPWLQDESHRIVETLRESARRECGRSLLTAADTAGLDARFAGEFGIPCVVFGPDGGGIHGIDEFVILDSVRTVARTLIRTIVAWQECGRGNKP